MHLLVNIAAAVALGIGILWLCYDIVYTLRLHKKLKPGRHYDERGPY